MRMELAEKIERLRGTQSYARLAKAIGCSPSNMHKIAREGGSTRFAWGVNLARELGVPADWLADDDADWPPPAGDDQVAADLVRGALEGAGLAGALNDDERAVVSALRNMAPSTRDRAVGFILGLGAGGSDEAGQAAAMVLQAGRASDRQAAQEQKLRRAGGHPA